MASSTAPYLFSVASGFSPLVATGTYHQVAAKL